MSTPEADGTADLDRAWWKEAVVYQIYPKSFDDSDGDGVGDLRGIVDRADYLAELGVDVVWLCPVYDSPHADNGYDIRDYRAIHDDFGDMADWEALRDALHERDIRLVMDLVVNHTSDEHEWFQRSRANPDGPYGDYYHWVDGDPDDPPNNWDSFFGGSAWSWDEERGAWYLHLFDEKQPDLNWRNPDVRREVEDLVRWWLERGIDGFRMDVINFIAKPEGYPDGDPDNPITGIEQFSHGPGIHDYLGHLCDEVLADYDAMTVGEMAATSVDQAAEYLLPDGDGLGMIFHFDHMSVDQGPGGPWDVEDWGDWALTDLKATMTRWQEGLADRGWNALYLGNHDQPRIVSRFGDDGEYRRESATLLATFLLTMQGTPYVYQGEEIGMTNADFRSLEEIDDVMTTGPITEMLEAGIVEDYEAVRDLVNYRSRDHARTPMQWTGGANAGFTDPDADPWLKLNEEYPAINVADARADPDSVWHYYREMIALRGESDVLVYGDYDLLLPDDEQFYAYTRSLGEETVLVVLNWSGERATFEADAVETADASVVICNYDDPPASPETRAFRPYEAVVYRL